MLNWTIWNDLYTESRVTLSDDLDMEGNYVFLITSSQSLQSVWQTFIYANTDFTTAGNFKMQALIRKNTNTGSVYLFARADDTTKEAYILEMKDNLRLYKGILGEDFLGDPLESIGDYIFPKNVTYHIEFAIHTEPNDQTFIQVKVGDRETVENWTTVFSVIVENETLLTGYWGFGMGTYSRRENFYFDNIKYFVET